MTRAHSANPADRTTFTWDSRHRLASLTAAGLTARFTYDVLGRRTARRITQAGEPARITQYVIAHCAVPKTNPTKIFPTPSVNRPGIRGGCLVEVRPLPW